MVCPISHDPKVNEIIAYLEALAWNMGHIGATADELEIPAARLREWRIEYAVLYAKLCDTVRDEAIAKAKSIRDHCIDALGKAIFEQLKILDIDAHVGEGVITAKEQAGIMAMKRQALKVISPALKVIDTITRLDAGSSTANVNIMTIEDRIKVMAEARKERQEKRQREIDARTNAN